MTKADPPSSYDLRDVSSINYVSSIKNQSGGTCWTHGTMAAIEGNLMITGNWILAGDTGEPNLAEYHLDWWNGFNDHNNDDIDPPDGQGLQLHYGGDYRVASAYLVRGEGAVRDIDGQSYGSTPERSNPDYHVYYTRDIEWYEAGEDLSNINLIKNKLMENGVIATCMCYDASFLDGSFNHYQPPENYWDPTHAIAIVGWDDDHATQAPQPGAWICKNSWGISWGLDGYFWISYYDKYCCKQPEMGAVSFQNVELMTYDRIHHHDYHGWRDTKTDCDEAFNVFTATQNERLLAVSFFTASDNVDYTVRIYGQFTGGVLQDELSSVSGNIAYTGFHTIDLVTPVELKQDDKFYIYLDLSSGGQPYDRSSDVPLLLGADYRTWVESSSEPGQSYYWSGSSWEDLYYLNSTANFCIKGLTIETGMKVTPSDFFESEGPSGGPFTPDGKIYLFAHKYNQSIAYSITCNPEADWITLSGDISGDLMPYDTAEVLVEINDNADTLGDGVHYATIYFTNLDDGVDDTIRFVKLIVGEPSLQYEWLLDTDPGWLTEGEWQFGQPTGEGGSFGFGADPTGGFTGDNVYGYNLYGNYPNDLPETHLTTPALDFSKLVRVHLKFQRWLANDDFGLGTVNISTDGATWTTVWSDGSWPPDSSWNAMDIDLSTVADSQSTVYLRWTMSVDNALYTFGGWNIDDIQIFAIYNTSASDVLCGDANGDELINIFDVTYLISYLYLGGPAPVPMMVGNVDGVGDINILDISYLISYLYLDGPEPDCR